MKKSFALSLTLLLVLFSLSSCTKKEATGSDALLNLLPKDSKGVFVVDIHGAMQTEFAQKTLKKEENYKKYQELVQKTGIDFEKDVFFLALAITGDFSQDDMDGAAVISLNYNKETLLAKIQEKTGPLTSADYNGVSIYILDEPEKSPEETEAPEEEATEEWYGGETEDAPKGDETPPRLAFLDEQRLTIGSEGGVKAVIDVFQNKAENVMKNAELAALLKKANQQAMFWGGLLIPEETVKKMTEGNPMLGSMEGLRSLLLFFDYKNKTLMAEIKAMGTSEEKNTQIAQFLTGLKALGGMAAAEKPEVGELMNSITITSGVDHVTISANIPEELLNRLSESAQKGKPESEEKD